MGNRPVISITAMSRAPGVDPEAWERLKNRGTEVYIPITMNIPGVTGADRYKIIRENSEYPETLVSVTI